jgi:hypothetical protein
MEIKNFIKIYDEVIPWKVLSNLFPEYPIDSLWFEEKLSFESL